VPFGCYYGSIDSTPLFIALAGQYWQHTGDHQTIDAIWPNIWLRSRGWSAMAMQDGDGFLEYRGAATAAW
jgi:glycogen debranching enzyme